MSLYHVIKLGQCQGKILILRKSFYATSSCPVCWGGHSIPSVLRASSYPSCPCLGPLLILSHLVCDRPKGGKWRVQSKVPGREQELSKWGDRFSWAFCKLTPQCNVQIKFFFITSNNPCHSCGSYYYPATSFPLLHLHCCHEPTSNYSSGTKAYSIWPPVFVPSLASAIILAHFSIYVADHLTSQFHKYLDHSSFEISKNLLWLQVLLLQFSNYSTPILITPSPLCIQTFELNSDLTAFHT